MSAYDENQHPRGRDGRWTRRAPSPPATTLPEPGPRVMVARTDAHGRDLSVPQAAIGMGTYGRDLGVGDDVEVRCPEHGAWLPDTPARVTVRGGSVCRTPDQSHGRFEVRDGARLIAHGGAHVRVHAASSVDVYDDAQADLHEAPRAAIDKYLHASRRPRIREQGGGLGILHGNSSSRGVR